jgi:hypothetical protein
MDAGSYAKIEAATMVVAFEDGLAYKCTYR